jgi:hypothetical protein
MTKIMLNYRPVDEDDLERAFKRQLDEAET